MHGTGGIPPAAEEMTVGLCAFPYISGLILTGHESGKVALFDEHSGDKVLLKARAYMDIVTDLQLSADRLYFITSSKNKTVPIHDAKTLTAHWPGAPLARLDQGQRGGASRHVISVRAACDPSWHASLLAEESFWVRHSYVFLCLPTFWLSSGMGEFSPNLCHLQQVVRTGSTSNNNEEELTVLGASNMCLFFSSLSHPPEWFDKHMRLTVRPG